MEIVLPLCVAAAAAFILSAACMPAVIALSRKRSWYDLPNERKIHTDPIPRIGGIGMFVGFLVAGVCVPLAVTLLRPGSSLSAGWRFLPLFLGFALIHVTGLIDDFHNLHALVKLALQIVAAAFVTAGGFAITRVGLPGAGFIPLGWLSYPVTVFWLVAISNALNLVDGVDGLAGGVTMISAVVLGAIGLLRGSPVTACIALALAGAAGGFLVFNLPPARIFMGDSGSLLVGLILGALPLTVAPGQTSIVDCVAPATVLVLPILDTISAIMRRLRERRPIHSPDRDHIHHKLLDAGLRGGGLLAVLYAVCAVFGGVAVGSLYLGRWPRVALFVGAWAAAVAALAILTAVRRGKSAEAAERT
jgi:UDP-GlcNAc:undecaprenyl-phosphate/decaprenyl-phosphate GlcNAc-1-phosphate transferase